MAAEANRLVGSLQQQRSWQSRPLIVKRAAEACLITMCCLSVLAPPITSPSADLWLKLEQVLLPLAVVGYSWMLLAGKAHLIRLNGLFAVALVYSVCIAISMWYGSEQLHQNVILRDFYEFPKAWLPVGFFTLAYEGELLENSLGRLFKFFGATIFLVCAYAWAQWAGLNFTYSLNAFYSSGLHDDVLINVRRVYATLGNANLLGELMTWSMAAFVLAALGGVGNRIWNIALAFGCLVTLAMTGSRYGLMNGCLTLVLIFALPIASHRQRAFRRNFLLFLAVAFALTFGAVAKSNQRTLERYETLRNPLQADSLRERLDGLWLDALDEIKQSPVWGRGPAKAMYTGIITDSEYLDVLKKFGIIGFVPYLGYFLFPLYLLVKGLQAAKRAGPAVEQLMPATVLVLRLSTIMVLLALVMNVGMGSFYNAPLQGFLWTWFGLGARSAKTTVDSATGLAYIGSNDRWSSA